ncbi:hypothetical protein [Rhizobium ruizarguesonis]|uniref:hypothetical protein n=1 Tax=Rhizobium ruizarguesonis TaxID=2081791 RepID=UPI001030AA61|nr:hypothetical protein [Rhizobium ruizarguesonis]TBF29318.1 hypothetical protein ELG93_02485 [Rhizobium ruizarguesonis]
MDKNAVASTLACLVIIMTCGVILVPKTSQDRLDEKLKALSDRIAQVSFWNFSTIERDIVFLWLEAIFQARVNSTRFYINVAAYTAIATALSLVAYSIVPFSDPLSVSLVGFPRFFLMGFLIPNMIVAVISMAITVGLLNLGARIRNGFVYAVIMAVDILAVTALIAALSINLELTRDYLVGLYRGEIVTNRWLVLYQPFIAIQYVVRHPVAILEALRAEFYISLKYTTYVVSVVAMVCAVVPLVLHTLAALFLVSMATFNNVMIKVASYLLNRMYEQKTFAWLVAAFGALLAFIELWDNL